MQTIREMRQAMDASELSARELTEAVLKDIAKRDGDIHAFLSVSETAAAEADEVDRRRKNGENLPALAGIPIAIKNNILVQGWKTTAGSQILGNYVAPYDATVIFRLRQAGAILIGATNLDEFAMGSSTENSAFGPTKNPCDPERIPGGSSGGSAAAVAAGFVPAALGTDTGGSIRQPAAMCGVVGLKPTYGRVSRYGSIAMASSLDQIGPIARTVEDAATLLLAIEGKDPKDATSAELPDTTIPELLSRDVKGLRLGVPKEYFVEGMDSEVERLVREAIKAHEAAGAEIEEISLPHAPHALAAYYVVMPCEVSSNMARYDGMRYGFSASGESLEETYRLSRGDGFGAEVKRRIMLGSFALSKGYADALYKKALKVRTLIKRDFDEAFTHVDAIIAPTSPSVAWKLGEKVEDPLTMYLSDIYTISANLATIPAMSIPCGLAHGLPVGLQLMAKPFAEATLFRLGAWFEAQTK